MKSWNSALISKNKTIRDAISVLDNSNYQIVLVVDNSNRLLGTITDGDIRRAILRGVDLNSPLLLVMNQHPIVVKPNEPREQILRLMKENHLRQIPVVDEHGIILDLDYVYDIVNDYKKDNVAVLMAGGLGKRLTPLTNDCPKPMLKIGGKPILETILENLIKFDINHFFFSVNYRAEMIQDYFEDGAKWGVKIDYLMESEPLGTAGSLGLLQIETNQPLLVMNGDILTKVNVTELFNYHSMHQSKATMCVREYNYNIPYGVITLDEKYSMKEIKEKPSYKYFVNAGIYALDPSVLKYIPKNQFYDITSLFEQLKALKEPVHTFPIREYWMDVGQHGDFKKAQTEYEEFFLI